MTRRICKRFGLGLLTALLALALAPAAEGYIYWSNTGLMGGGNTIGRADLAGTNVNESFIHTPGHATLCGVAVSATHIYWASSTGGPEPRPGQIGRANLDGSGVNPGFIQNAKNPCGVAVTSTHVYWGNDHAIGRANIDGTGVDQSFVATTPGYVFGIAANSTHLFWANSAGATQDRSIGRVALDGSNVSPTFISTAGEVPNGVAVNSTHVFWGGVYGGAIGRANVDGGGTTNAFVTNIGGDVCGLAVTPTNLYWSDWSTQRIGRAGLDGSAQNNDFIDLTGTDQPCGVAVDADTAAVPPTPDPGDKDPPETEITEAPKKLEANGKSTKARFKFRSDEANSTFECKLDDSGFKPCTSAYIKKVKLGKHKFSVLAIDPSGNADPTPDGARFKVKSVGDVK